MTALSRLSRSTAARITATLLLTTVGFGTTLTVPAPAIGAPVTAQPFTLLSQTDSIRDGQWHLGYLKAEAAWRHSTGAGVIVAVIDSGVDGSHPDLAGQVLPGLDLVRPPDADRTDADRTDGDQPEDGRPEGEQPDASRPDPTPPDQSDEGQPTDGQPEANQPSNGPDGDGSSIAGQLDPVGHGTTVASLIAGRSDDSRGIVGLAPHAKILPVRVLDENNRYDDALIVAEGIRWAVDNGARVINLSLGGSSTSLALAAAIDYAFTRDVVVIACTGNLSAPSGSQVWYPAREPGVIAVAGLESDSDQLWSGSITGPETVLTAPATGIVGARPGGFWHVQGTSFAAPMVAATAALIRARWPEMPAGDVINRLIRTARDLGPVGRDDRFGFGVVNPVAALADPVPKVDRNPLDDDSSPGVVGFGSAPSPATTTSSTLPRPNQLGGPVRSISGLSAQPTTAPTTVAGTVGWRVFFAAILLGSAMVIRWRWLRPTIVDTAHRRYRPPVGDPAR